MTLRRHTHNTFTDIPVQAVDTVSCAAFGYKARSFSRLPLLK